MAWELLLAAVAAACVLATVGVLARARARGADAATRLIVLAAVAWSASRLLGWQACAAPPASAWSERAA